MSEDDDKPLETDDDGWGQAADLERALSDQKEAEENPDRFAPLDPLAAKVAERPAEAAPGRGRDDADEPPGDRDAPGAARERAVDDDFFEADEDADDAEWGDDLTPVPRTVESPAEAAGVRRARPPGRSRGDGGRGKASRILLLIAAGILLLSVGGLLSWWNHQHFYYVCGTKTIRAERGSTWPWGQSRLEGAAFRPIPIPPDVECESREVASRRELEDAFLDALLEQASSLLVASDPEAVTLAELELQQALLIARDPERRDARKRIERLLGDVEYWRAAAEVKSAIDTLENAARRFDDASARRPRHHSDASAWGAHARQQASELKRGPLGQRDPIAGPPEEPHFAGTGSESDEADDAPTPDGEPAPAPEPAAPDAGLPRGGVLL